MLAVSALLIPLGALAGTAQPFRCTPTHSHARSSPVSPLRLSVTLTLSLVHSLALSLYSTPASSQLRRPQPHKSRARALSAALPAARSPPTLLYVFLGLFINLSVPHPHSIFFWFPHTNAHFNNYEYPLLLQFVFY